MFAQIKLEKHHAEGVRKFENAIKLIDKVLECYVMTGQSDYLLKVVVEDLHHYEQFVRRELQNIDNIASIDTSFAYGVVKRSHVLPAIRSVG